MDAANEVLISIAARAAQDHGLSSPLKVPEIPFLKIGRVVLRICGADLAT